MERTYKTWGEKWNVFKNDLCEVSLLYLKPSQRCSWHRHATKSNQFFVIEGVVWIMTEWGEAEIAKGQIFTTAPGEWHEFQTREDSAILQEVMYVQYNAEDIERKKLGGPLEGEEDDKESQVWCAKCGKAFAVYPFPNKCFDCGGTEFSSEIDQSEPTALANKLREVLCPACGTTKEYIDEREYVICEECETSFIPINAHAKIMP